MITPAEFNTLKQTVDELDGARRFASPGRQAVRVDDLRTMLFFDPVLKATEAAGAAPTKAEFDALVADVRSLHQRMGEIVDMLRGKLRR
jgi:hypothetical protein